MSKWNYRVYYNPEHKKYSIKEAYYDNKKDQEPHSYTVSDIAPMMFNEFDENTEKECIDELRCTLKDMLAALEKPVLTDYVQRPVPQAQNVNTKPTMPLSKKRLYYTLINHIDEVEDKLLSERLTNIIDSATSTALTEDVPPSSVISDKDYTAIAEAINQTPHLKERLFIENLPIPLKNYTVVLNKET